MVALVQRPARRDHQQPEPLDPRETRRMRLPLRREGDGRQHRAVGRPELRPVELRAGLRAELRVELCADVRAQQQRGAEKRDLALHRGVRHGERRQRETPETDPEAGERSAVILRTLSRSPSLPSPSPSPPPVRLAPSLLILYFSFPLLKLYGCGSRTATFTYQRWHFYVLLNARINTQAIIIRRSLLSSPPPSFFF